MTVLVRTQSEVTEEELQDPEVVSRSFRPRGASKEFLACKLPEVIVSGPAGTGKSYAALNKLYMVAQKYAGCRLAIVRRYRSTITQSAMNTFDKLVRVPGDKVKFNSVDQEYNFPNGSQVVVAGLDDPTKILSTEFDIIYVQEATEIDEPTWEILSSRLRWNHVPYQQIIGDCNPASERHWIMRRYKAAKLHLIHAEFTDNPTLWDEEAQTWTEQGQQYIDKLQALSGVMRARLYEGRWVGAEGAVFTEYSAERNLVDPFPIPDSWPRYIAVDFGYTNPFVAQWWAEDHDGRLYLYRELYGIHTPVEDWAHRMHDLSKKEHIKAIICDHDEEDRATLERHMAHSASECYGGREKEYWKVPKNRRATLPADKKRESVRTGIEQVQSRLKPAGDGKPRLYFFKGALVAQDAVLVEAKKPTSTLEEIDEYVWDEIKNSRYGERVLEHPKKMNDHGMDAMRYMVRYVDGQQDNIGTSVWGKQVRNTYGKPPEKKTGSDILFGSNRAKTDFWKR
jgi:PBSX family phage terminase large subunit